MPYEPNTGDLLNTEALARSRGGSPRADILRNRAAAEQLVSERSLLARLRRLLARSRDTAE